VPYEKSSFTNAGYLHYESNVSAHG